MAITTGKRSVKNFEWSPDGKQIAYLAPDAKTDAEEKKEKEKDDARVADKEDKRARLWLIAPGTRKTRVLTKRDWEVTELAWLPSGDRLIVKATDHPESDQYTEQIFSMETSNGSHDGTGRAAGAVRGAARVGGRKELSYVGSREDGPEPHDLWLLR